MLVRDQSHSLLPHSPHLGVADALRGRDKHGGTSPTANASSASVTQYCAPHNLGITVSEG